MSSFACGLGTLDDPADCPLSLLVGGWEIPACFMTERCSTLRSGLSRRP